MDSSLGAIALGFIFGLYLAVHISFVDGLLLRR